MCYMLSCSCFKKSQTPKYWSYLKKADFKTTAVSWEPYDHVYVCVYRKPTEKMKNCMVTRAVQQCLEITPTDRQTDRHTERHTETERQRDRDRQRVTTEKKVEIFPEKSSIKESREAKIDIENRLQYKPTGKNPIYVIESRLQYRPTGKNPICVICNKEKFHRKGRRFR